MPTALVYNNNRNLKAAGVPVQFSQDQVYEYVKCAADPIYFIKKYAKIVSLDDGVVSFIPFPYQERMIKAIHENKNTLGKLFRQAGKSTIVAAYFAWYVLFNENKTAVILANKQAIAIEIFSRVQFIIENIPFWLQQGIVEWNKKSLVLENGSRCIAAATSASAVRGMSCVVGDTKVCIDLDDHIYYSEISKFINASKLVEDQQMNIKYCVYQITNKINKKIYVGFHKTLDLDDGYMGSGKLIKKAIEKYGIENFEKVILKVFDTKEEAEAYEAEIVDKEFTLREDTYNVAIGGNVRISYGPNNGFYGKNHGEESLKAMSQAKIGNNNAHTTKFIVNGDVVDGYDEVALTLGIEKSKRRNVILACGNPDIDVRYQDEVSQQEAENFFIQNEVAKADKLTMLADNARKRFTGYTWSEERNQSISKSLTGREHPWQDKINQNPDKIRKTAEKHRGMKRSEEARQKMSDAKRGNPSSTKGKSRAIDQHGTVKYFNRYEILPEGWVWQKS